MIVGKKPTLLIPKQHGAWAMLGIPFGLGAYAGGFSWFHLPLFLGWLCLHLAKYPFLMTVKTKRKNEYMPWFYCYFSFAVMMFLIPLLYHPMLINFGIAMVPFFLMNLYYAKKKNERAFFNDVAAIAAFCIGGLASFYVGRGALTIQAFELSLFSFLFFIGSTFYVKTMIREKKNSIYKWGSWIYHFLLIVVLVMIGYPLFALAYVPSVIRAISLYGKSLSVTKVGILEIANSAYFLLVMLIFLS
ncbi:YwiC-like family protein [Thermaerobacillus caldiproteolyticus]|uniref:YwiC-like family protein n=1 Tax=Thermaerobacillus caldiproteolyticus TaxID=247480 RepID=UPI00188A58BB|nr:YwiC-like family protein [Anoxybacillus caldiproteolyticus]QPA31706.1 YwiC-like family protein [Anoxybacillus caldiproteolyticus]